MPRSAKVKKDDGWKFHLEGASDHEARRHHVERYFRLHLKFGPGADCTLAGAPDFASRLKALLGDHQVQLGVGALHPKAWGTDLPWKRRAYGHSLRLRLCQFAEASLWRRAEECVQGADFTLRAHRGGGAARHLAWEFQYQGAGEIVGGHVTLLLTERMFRAELSSELRSLTCSFFSLGDDRLKPVYGCGDLVYRDDFSLRGEWSVESWAYENFLDIALDEGKHQLPGVRWITFISAEQLRRLGGIQSLKASAAELAGIVSLENSNMNLGEHPVEQVHVEPTREGAAVFLASMDDVLSGSCYTHGARREEPGMGGWRVTSG